MDEWTNGRMRLPLLEPLVWRSHRRGNGLGWDGKGQEDPVEVEWEGPGSESEIPLPVLVLRLGTDRGAFVMDTYRRVDIELMAL